MPTHIQCRPKYGITERRDGYRGVMLLVVRSFSPSDVGTYHCVSTNSLGRAEGTLRLYGAYTQSLLHHLPPSQGLICFVCPCFFFLDACGSVLQKSSFIRAPPPATMII